MPVPTQSEDTSESQHVHSWAISAYNTSEEVCLNTIPTKHGSKPCPLIRISSRTNQRRIDEWDNYYALEETTPSHILRVKIHKAFVAGNIGEVKRLHKELRSIGREVDNDGDIIGTHWEPKEMLPAPPFRDPRNYPWQFLIQDD